ncbi:hypothetical protein FRC03_001988 [Tulasnella sp. 419]|nr:hypothetical protein FRC03_001988 [Tulasnella sp. 419]
MIVMPGSPQKALATDDILSLIFETLYQESTSYRIIAPCSRVNRKFHAAAHRWLWRSLPHLMPLVSLLPEDAVEVTPTSATLKRPLIQPDWKKFVEYGRCVRTIAHNDAPSTPYRNCPQIDPSILLAIAMHWPHTSPLPNLVEIQWSTGTKRGALGLLPFCTPSLRSVQFVIKPGLPAPVMDSVLERLANQSGLESLTISSRPHATSPVSQSALDTLLLKQRRLKKLDLSFDSPVQSHILPTLLTLPNLQVLHITLRDMDALRAIPPSEVNPRMPSLEKLWVIGSPSATSYFIHNVNIRPSHTLAVHSVDYEAEHPRVSGLAPIFHAIDTFPSRELTKLDVMVSHWGQGEIENPDDYAMPSRLLEPIWEFSTLITIRLDLGIPLMLTDADVRRIVTALPNLQNLNLGAEPRYTHDDFVPGMTLATLVTISTHCRYISCVSLFINATKGFEAYNPLVHYDSPLVSLNLGRSWIESNYEENVAILISDVLPNVENPQYTIGDEEEGEGFEDDNTHEVDDDDEGTAEDHADPHCQATMTKCWRNVHLMLSVLRKVRRLERQRIAMSAER